MSKSDCEKAIIESSQDSSKATIESPAASSRIAWLFAVSAFVCNFATIGLALSFCVFLDWFRHSLFPLENIVTISLVGSLQYSIFYSVAGVTFPPTWSKSCLMLSGAICCTGSLIWCSFARHLAEILVAQGILFAFGAAVIHATMASLAAQRNVFRSNTLAIFVPSGALCGALFWSTLVGFLIKTMAASSVFRIIAIVLAVLLTCPVISMWCLCSEAQVAVPLTKPPTLTSSSMEALHVVSVFFVYLGIPMPLMFIAFWGADSDFGGICSSLSVLFFAFAIVGHLLSLYLGQYVSSPQLLFVQTGVAGLLILAFPIMATSALMVLAGSAFGGFLGHVLVNVFATHQLHRRHCILDTTVASIGLFISGPICALILQASDGGRFGMSYFAGGCLVLGCCLVRIYEALEDVKGDA